MDGQVSRPIDYTLFFRLAEFHRIWERRIWPNGVRALWGLRACFNKSGNGCTLRRFLPPPPLFGFFQGSPSFTSGGLSPFVPAPQSRQATRRSLEYQMTPERTFVSLSSFSQTQTLSFSSLPFPLLPSCKDAHRAHHKTTKPDRQNRQRTVSHLPPLHTMCVYVCGVRAHVPARDRSFFEASDTFAPERHTRTLLLMALNRESEET